MNSTETPSEYKTESLTAPIVPVSPAPAPRKSGRWIMLLALVTFAGGAAASWWVISQWHGWFGRDLVVTSAPSTVPVTASGPVTPNRMSAQPVPLPSAGLAEQAMALRVTEMEDRLARISVQAQAASGNAARAEGLLIAIAARRALDNGASLGYIEGQLRLRFGQAQPRAVATIINAAREPVTLADLQAGLAEIAPRLIVRGPDESWWRTMKREMGGLIVFRQAGTPLPSPEAQMERATRYLNAGRVDAALKEVSAMPGRAVADRWMQMARRYHEARRALGLIETAAILEPRQLRAIDGGSVVQASPLTP